MSEVHLTRLERNASVIARELMALFMQQLHSTEFEARLHRPRIVVALL